MKRVNLAILLSGALFIGLATSVTRAQKPATATATPRPAASAQTPKPAPPAPKAVAAAAPAADHNAVIKRYCVTCHSDARKTGGLSLASFDVTHASQNAEVAEKVI